MALKREFVEVNNHRWAFLRFGRGKPIVLLHGFLNYADYFEKLAGLLADEFEVIVPDLPGFGYTEAGDLCSYKTISKELFFFLKKLEIEKASFFGASLGGAILIDFALNYPKTVEIAFIQSALWKKNAIRMNPLERIEVFLANSPDFLTKIIQKPLIARFFLGCVLRNCSGGKLFSLYGNKIIESISLLNIKSTKKCFFSLMNGDLKRRVKDLKTKTVLIVGQEDKVIPVEETEDLAGRIKNDLVVIVRNEDHEIMLDAPEKLAEIIKDYAVKGKKAVDPVFIWKEI